MAENRELTLAISINPKKPTKGLLLGTDFRHAVEFSRSGRTRNPAVFTTLILGGIPTLHQAPQQSNPGSVTPINRCGTLAPCTTGSSLETFPGIEPAERVIEPLAKHR